MTPAKPAPGVGEPPWPRALGRTGAGLVFAGQRVTEIAATPVTLLDESEARSRAAAWVAAIGEGAVSYTHLTLPTILRSCRSRWSPYH